MTKTVTQLLVLMLLGSIAWKTFQREAPRGEEEGLAGCCPLSVLLRVWGVESLRLGAVAHANFGPKRASNSRSIYSNNKINIQSRPLGPNRRLDFLRAGDRLGSRGKWGCCAESIPSLMSAAGVM